MNSQEGPSSLNIWMDAPTQTGSESLAVTSDTSQQAAIAKRNKEMQSPASTTNHHVIEVIDLTLDEEEAFSEGPTTENIKPNVNILEFKPDNPLPAGKHLSLRIKGLANTYPNLNTLLFTCTEEFGGRILIQQHLMELCGLQVIELSHIDLHSPKTGKVIWPAGLLSLKLKGCNLWGIDNITCPVLEELCILGGKDLAKSLTVECPKLLVCSITGMKSTKELKFDTCEDLEELDISGTGLKGYIDIPKGVEILKGIGCTSLQCVDASGCSNLKEIDLSGCISLKQLVVFKATMIESMTIHECSSLRNLDLSWCENLVTILHTDGSMGRVGLYATGCPLLDVLGVSQVRRKVVTNNPLDSSQSQEGDQ